MTDREIQFRVLATPRPQPRPRKVHGVWVSTASPKAKFWRSLAVRECRAAMEEHGWTPLDPPLLSGALELPVEFGFRPPASALHRIGSLHTQKPNADNLLKGLMDAMQQARLFHDDCQIAAPSPVKLWSEFAYSLVVVRRGAAPIRGGVSSVPDWLAG